MSNLSDSRFCFVISILLASLCWGCATKEVVPIHSDPSFAQSRIDNSINLLPVIDCRKDKTFEVNLERLQRVNIHPIVEKNLEKRDFEVRVLTDASLISGITYDDIRDPEESWIKNLGPTDARYVLLITLEDLQSQLSFGSKASAVMSGVLLDKSSATVVWRDKNNERFGAAGPFGLLIKGVVHKDAIMNCTANLMKSFPENAAASK